MPVEPSVKLGLVLFIFAIWSIALTGCNGAPHIKAKPEAKNETEVVPRNSVPVIHVVVALCDNKYQGIIPVPARIGNGDDLIDNLYWGADYGVKTYFRHSSDWKLIQNERNISPIILERVVFRQKSTGAIMVADAYRGREIRTATQDFANFSAGLVPSKLQVSGKTLQIASGAGLIVFVGHNGLMNFKLPNSVRQKDNNPRAVAILCCKSQQYFGSIIRDSGAKPLLLTKSLMAPEAYVLDAAIKSFVRKETNIQSAERASKAYAKYQHISLKSARTVFALGI